MVSLSLLNYVLYFLITICLNLIKPTSTEQLQWNLHGKPGEGYYLAVNIGRPSQKFNLLIDTGSSNLAVAGSYYPGLESYFKPKDSTTFIYNGSFVEVVYTQGWWKGYIGQDFVSFPSLPHVEPTLTDLSIIEQTYGFYINRSHWQGILGMAYEELAQPRGYGSWFDAVTDALPQATNQRFDLQLCGSDPNNMSSHYGRFTVGDLKSACPKSDFVAKVRRKWFYEVLITGLKVGEVDLDISCVDFNHPRTIIDSGTTNLQLSGRSYYEVIYKLKSHVENYFYDIPEDFWWNKKEICKPSSEVFSVFPTITIFLYQNATSQFGIVLPPSAYLRHFLNKTNADCLVLGLEKAEIGTVLGTVALEGFCLMFDREKGEIYFSVSDCGPNVTLSRLSAQNDLASCHYVLHVVNGPLIASVVVLIIMLVPLFFAFIKWGWTRWGRPNTTVRVPFISLDDGTGNE